MTTYKHDKSNGSRAAYFVNKEKLYSKNSADPEQDNHSSAVLMCVYVYNKSAVLLCDSTQINEGKMRRTGK